MPHQLTRAAPPSPRTRRENGARGARWFARVSWSLPVVAGAGSQVDGDGSVLVEENSFICSAINVGRGEGLRIRGVRNPVSVVTNILGRKRRSCPLFLDDGILVGVLRGILIHERSQGSRAVACVLVPVVVGVQAGVDQELEDLVGGGVGPLLAREGQHASHERGGYGGALNGDRFPRVHVVRGVWSAEAAVTTPSPQEE